MAKAVEECLGEWITEGLIVVKPGHSEPLRRIRVVEGSHPVPDGSSVKATQEYIHLAQEADENTLIINLISGGGSALLCSPYSDTEHSLSLEDKQKTTSLLLSCGARIDEINTIRKHLSGIKGGRLAQLFHPAESINLILSDVVGDPLSVIASGPTVPDPTTYGRCIDIIQRYSLIELLPRRVVFLLNEGQSGVVPETPPPGDPAFDRVTNLLVGNNRIALVGAAEVARGMGYNTTILTSRFIGETRTSAEILWGIVQDTKYHSLMITPPCCIILGGETTVTVLGNGKGGRNQEFALGIATRMVECPQDAEGVYFLSAGTDGNDGDTDVAGAFADKEIVQAATRSNMNPQIYLENNDSYNFFDPIDGLLRTGPTNTNVCDIQIALIL